jgi:hypothetical protein
LPSCSRGMTPRPPSAGWRSSTTSSSR